MGTAPHWQKPLVALNCAHRLMIHAAFPIHIALFYRGQLQLPHCPSPLSRMGLYQMHISLFKSLFLWALGTLWGPKANCSFLSPTDLFLPLFLAVSLLISFLQVSLSLSLSLMAFFQPVLCFRSHSCTVWSLCLINRAAHYIQEPFAICLGFYEVSCHHGVLVYSHNCVHMVFFVYSCICVYYNI